MTTGRINQVTHSKVNCCFPMTNTDQMKSIVCIRNNKNDQFNTQTAVNACTCIAQHLMPGLQLGMIATSITIVTIQTKTQSFLQMRTTLWKSPGQKAKWILDRQPGNKTLSQWWKVPKQPLQIKLATSNINCYYGHIHSNLHATNNNWPHKPFNNMQTHQQEHIRTANNSGCSSCKNRSSQHDHILSNCPCYQSLSMDATN